MMKMPLRREELGIVKGSSKHAKVITKLAV